MRAAALWRSSGSWVDRSKALCRGGYRWNPYARELVPAASCGGGWSARRLRALSACPARAPASSAHVPRSPRSFLLPHRVLMRLGQLLPGRSFTPGALAASPAAVAAFGCRQGLRGTRRQEEAGAGRILGLTGAPLVAPRLQVGLFRNCTADHGELRPLALLLVLLLPAAKTHLPLHRLRPGHLRHHRGSVGPVCHPQAPADKSR